MYFNESSIKKRQCLVESGTLCVARSVDSHSLHHHIPVAVFLEIISCLTGKNERQFLYRRTMRQQAGCLFWKICDKPVQLDTVAQGYCKQQAIIATEPGYIPILGNIQSRIEQGKAFDGITFIIGKQHTPIKAQFRAFNLGDIAFQLLDSLLLFVEHCEVREIANRYNIKLNLCTVETLSVALGEIIGILIYTPYSGERTCTVIEKQAVFRHTVTEGHHSHIGDKSLNFTLRKSDCALV